MFSRLSQISRHLPRAQPLLTQSTPAAGRRDLFRVTKMAAITTADERNSRTIHTAACLIIGDEVLGGKVG